MSSDSALALSMCQDHLTVQHLRDICRFRGFPLPKGGKDALVQVVAPRLEGTDGVAMAAVSLAPEWLWVAHFLAWNGSAVPIEPICERLELKPRVFFPNLRAFLGRMETNLINRGLLQVLEAHPNARSATDRMAYRLWPAHAALLPPCPIPVQAAGDFSPRYEVLDFARDVLRERVRMEQVRGSMPVTGNLKARVADSLSFGRGILCRDEPLFEIGALLKAAQQAWLEPTGVVDAALGFSRWILSHLPEGAGVTSADLLSTVQRWAAPLDAQALERFLDQGLEAGFVETDGTKHLFRATSPPDRAVTATFTARGTREGLEIDPSCSDPGLVLSVCALGSTRVVGDLIAVAPDPVLLDRASTSSTNELFVNHALKALQQIRKTSPPWDRALNLLSTRKNRLILHEGLVLLRVEDTGFRFKIESTLASRALSLGGPFLAIPADDVGKVEKLAKKNGYCPKYVEGAPHIPSGADGE